MRRLGLATLIFASVAAATVVVPPGTAFGHDGCVQSAFEPSIACGRNNHRTVDACDRHADGHWVWAQVYIIDGAGSTGDRYVNVSDTNGSASGCGTRTWDGEIDYVYGFQVCVQYEGCGPWKTIGYHP